MSNNNLVGDLNPSFSAGNFTFRLTSIDVSNNAFTGSIPVAVFGGNGEKQLKEFIGGTNCYSGSIPSEVCYARKLQTLDISGMTASSACIYPYRQFPLDFYMVRTVPGEIPECIFSSSTIQVISLSGNAIRSPLYDIDPASQLTNVSLAYNRLEGTIPLSIQQYENFVSLDLSYNRLEGTIENLESYDNATHLNFSSTSVVLKSNRLSGFVPSSCEYAENIDILAGNMFQCKNSDTLPENDPAVESYTCGSGDVNPYLITTAILVVIMLLRIVWSRAVTAVGTFVHEFVMWVLRFLHWSAADSTGHPSVDKLCGMMKLFRSYMFWLLSCAILVLLPLYLGMKLSGFGSHTYQYAWLPSLAFMNDITPATALLVVWMVLVPCLACFDVVMGQSFRNAGAADHSVILPDVVSLPTARYLYVALLANFVVVLVVNGVYVATVLTTTTTERAFLVVAISAFKTVWTSGIVSALKQFDVSNSLLLSTAIFSNILAPVLSTAFVDVNCFQSLFIKPAPVLNRLVIHNFRCAIGTETDSDATNAHYKSMCIPTPYYQEIDFPPPFIYSQQCASTLVTNYVPVYIMTYGIINILLLLMQVGVLLYFDDASSTAPARRYSSTVIAATTTGGDGNSPVARKRRWLKKIKGNAFLYFALSAGTLCLRTLPFEPDDPMEPLLDPLAPLYSLQDFGGLCMIGLFLLLTFGMAYPPLGVVIALNMVLLSIVRQFCVLKHYQQIKNIPEKLALWEAALKDEVDNLAAILFNPKPLTIVCGALFACIFIIDMINDTGLNWSVIYVSILLSWAVVVAIVYFFYERHLRDLTMSAVESVSPSRTVEMLLIKSSSILRGSSAHKELLDWPVRQASVSEKAGTVDTVSEPAGIEVENPLQQSRQH